MVFLRSIIPFLFGGKAMRIGFGYDVHRFVEGRALRLGGVEIPYEKGLLGHSDADVLIHALIDALFGAAALGDIGTHFPDTDAAYKGVDSRMLLRHAVQEVRDAGYAVQNADMTVVCQAPKLAPYLVSIRKSLADLLGVDVSCVSVKGKTEEGLGFTGTGDGIKVYAVCLLCHV